MHTHHTVVEALFHALEESVHLLPYLFVTYLILEYLEKRTENISLFFSKTKSYFAPILAALTGILPQCGLGVAGANFYAARVISRGTLVALFLSTSDEMLPVLLSNGISIKVIASIILYKTLIALLAGLLLDMLMKKKNKQNLPFEMHTLCHQADCGCHQKKIWISALNHTAHIFVFILAVNALLHTLFLFIHPNELKEILFTHNVMGPFFSTLFGLIPNCATSVVSAQLFADGTLPDGAFLSAVLANAGIGLIVLFHVNRRLKQNLKIITFISLVSFLSGFIFNLLNLSF